MKHVILFVLNSFIILLSSCSSDSQVTEKAVSEQNGESYRDKEIAAHQTEWKDITPYTIDFDFQYAEIGVYALNVTVIPDEGSYILSHFSDDSFSGKFRILMENENITLVDDLEEFPPSRTVFEPFSRTDTPAITKRTMCSQRIKLNTTEDFQFDGLVQFTIEPKCTFEKNHFTITQKNGILSIVKKP